MKSKLLLFNLAILFVIAFVFNACEKENDTDVDFGIETSEDNALVDLVFDDVFNMAEQYGNDNLIKSTVEGPCEPTVTRTSSEGTYFPRIITIDFGETNCETLRGRTVRGKMITKLTAKYREVGSQKIVTFENFYSNDNLIEGTKTITNNGRNNDGYLSRTIDIKNGKITTPDGKVLEKTSTRTRVWIKGEDTPLNFTDDEFEITGNSTGINRKGLNYTTLITKPLNAAVECKWFRSGTIEITVGERPTATLDYGDGECDNKATVTVGDVTKEIQLR